MTTHFNSKTGDQRTAQTPHEPDGTNVRRVYFAAGGLTLALGVIALGVWGLAQRFDRMNSLEERASSSQRWRGSVDGKPLRDGRAIQERPPAGVVRQDIDQRDATRLRSYGWMDREAGIAHIPIERAIELTVAEPDLLQAMLKAMDSTSDTSQSIRTEQDMEEQ